MDAIQIAKQRKNDFLGPATVVTDSRGSGRVDEGERSNPWEGSYVPLSTQHHYPHGWRDGELFHGRFPLLVRRIRSLCPVDCPLAPWHNAVHCSTVRLLTGAS